MRIIFLLLLAGAWLSHASAQTQSWFFSPEAGTILHGDHLGRYMGLQTGFFLARNRLKAGFFYYGRSGPINPQTYTLALPEGSSYKGKTELSLRADHGAFGLFVSPLFPLGEKWRLEVPLLFGQMGAGFYLTGEDRETPDGRRVSEWEDELMGDTDAGFGWLLEGGLRFSRSLSQAAGMRVGAGLHYSQTIGYQSFVGGTDFYKRPRLVLFMEFGG